MALTSRARYTCQKPLSMKVVRGAVVGWLGVIKRSQRLRTGHSHPGTHVDEHRLSGLRSSHNTIVPDK